MSENSADQDIIKRAINGEFFYVCLECAKKHRTREGYGGSITMHTGTCAICKKETSVGPSRKLFGMHRFL